MSLEGAQRRQNCGKNRQSPVPRETGALASRSRDRSGHLLVSGPVLSLWGSPTAGPSMEDAPTPSTPGPWLKAQAGPHDLGAVSWKLD